MDRNLPTAPLATLPKIRLPAGSAPVACVDIGGTKIAVSIADPHGLHSRLSEPTVKSGCRDALAQQVIRLITQSCVGAGVAPDALGGVGVSSCGPFVMRDGLLELAAPNICGAENGPSRGFSNDWVSVPLEGPLRLMWSHVRVENDGVAALAAERRWGALQGLAHCAYVTWSTGIGMGLCVDGKLLRGKNGNAGHAGHMFVTDDTDAVCGCGNVGDVEALISGTAVTRRFSAVGYTDAAALFAAAYAGDLRAEQIVNDLCRVMGRTLYNLVVALDLQRISIGGSVAWNHRNYLLPRLNQHLYGKLGALTGGVEIVGAGLGGQVGDYAALALVAA